MDGLDQRLEDMIREWIVSDARGLADVLVKPATIGGPPALEVRPRNAGALTITLWVADDGAHIGFGIGGGSWWADHVPLKEESVRELLSAVAAARAGEEVRRLGRRIVARRGYVELASKRRLTYREISVFALLPGLRWEPLIYEPYSPQSA
jgi:hypothetical protein